MNAITQDALNDLMAVLIENGLKEFNPPVASGLLASTIRGVMIDNDGNHLVADELIGVVFVIEYGFIEPNPTLGDALLAKDSLDMAERILSNHGYFCSRNASCLVVHKQ